MIMDTHKICFICCTNDTMYEKECCYYLDRLNIPDGITVEVKMVHGAVSMASGYNQAMRESDAKYKVYLHQDVFLLNSDFIQDMLQVFSDERVGMIGVVGGDGLPENGIIYSAWNCGRLKTNDSYASFEIMGKIQEKEEGLIVEAVDGCLIATQYDLPWREDLFTAWDFYDASQAIEFRKKGYLVKLPVQESCWCFHDDGYQNLQDYDQEREIFIREYGSYLRGKNIEKQVEFHSEMWNITQEIKGQLISSFDRGEYEIIYAFLCENYLKLSRDTELSVLRNVMEIWYEEQIGGSENCFFCQGELWREVKRRYQQYKFWLYRMEFGVGDGEQRLTRAIAQKSISAEALVKLISHNTIEKKEVLYRFAEIYQSMGDMRISELLQKMQNDKKVAFIICTNNEHYQSECSSYLMELEVPEGYEIEILPIIGAKSMAAGYNQGMRQSDAKYKIYLHQDVFVWNRHFIYDLLEIFESSEVGMMGVLGGIDIPDDGILYRAWNVGMSYACDTEDAGIKQGKNPEQGTCHTVEAIDGMLMATQYDFPWREDLFTGWDFYDISQSFEFRKRGYSVVVPHQETPWCMHDCGRTKLQDYNEGRRILLQEYASFFKNPVYRESDFLYNLALKQKYECFRDEIIRCMKCGELETVVQMCTQYDDTSIMDSDLSLLKKFATVCETEYKIYGECRTWKPGESYEMVKEKYNNVKFLLWDIERNRNTKKISLKDALWQGLYSIPLVVMAGIHNIFHFEKIIPSLAENAKSRRSLKDLDYLEFVANQISLENPIPFDEMRVELQNEVSVFKSEEEILGIEKICRENARLREEELPEKRRYIEQLLQEGNREALSVLLTSEEFIEKFGTVTDMAYMMLVNQIYWEEVADGISHTVLDGKNSIDDIMYFIQEIKFGLWRLEFDVEESAGIQFVELVRRNQISGCLLKYIVHVAGMDKVGILGRLAALFLEQDLFGMAFSMLKYANELCPGTEEILCTMAELCLQVGKKDEALYCLEQVKQPTNITESFRKLCES